MQRIPPRSPREVMAGWHYLPRFVDKIRLHLAGKLHSDYQDNFLKKGFDALWLESAGVEGDAFVKVVASTITDGEVCDWVEKNLKKSAAEKEAHWQKVLIAGTHTEESRARLTLRKKESGFENRSDITCFVEYIDADEGRI